MMGYEEPLPTYVDDVLLAKWIGIPVWELEDQPYWYVEQMRAVRDAEFAAKSQIHERRNRR
jgi:hypothetical protein